MVLYAYTGLVTDVVKQSLNGWVPEMTVRPAVEAFGPDALVSAVRVPVPLNAATGAFTMRLIASAELTPVGGGRAGVDYIISVGRFELADDNKTVWHGTDSWQFTAIVGGGKVSEMAGRPTESNIPWGFGPPPSSITSGLYYDASAGMMYGAPGGN